MTESYDLIKYFKLILIESNQVNRLCIQGLFNITGFKDEEIKFVNNFK